MSRKANQKLRVDCFAFLESWHQIVSSGDCRSSVADLLRLYWRRDWMPMLSSESLSISKLKALQLSCSSLSISKWSESGQKGSLCPIEWPMDDPTCLSQSMTCLHGFDAIFAWPFCIPIFSTHEPMNRFQQEQQSLLPTLPLSRSFVGIPERSSIFWRRGLNGPSGMVIIGWNKRQMVNRWSTDGQQMVNTLNATPRLGFLVGSF